MLESLALATFVMLFMSHLPWTFGKLMHLKLLPDMEQIGHIFSCKKLALAPMSQIHSTSRYLLGLPWIRHIQFCVHSNINIAYKLDHMMSHVTAHIVWTKFLYALVYQQLHIYILLCKSTLLKGKVIFPWKFFCASIAPVCTEQLWCGVHKLCISV